MKTMNFSENDAQDRYTINKQTIIVVGGFNAIPTNCRAELTN